MAVPIVYQNFVPPAIDAGNLNDVNNVVYTVIGNGTLPPSNAADVRNNIGLGTIATQNANAVNVTGGTITGASITSVGASITTPTVTGGTITGATITGGSVSGLEAPVAVADGGTGDSGTQWSTQTVTPVSGVGTLTSASAVWRFKLIGKTAFFSCVCTITNNGTGGGSILIPLPTGWAPKTTSAWGGQASASSGKAFSARVTVGNTNVILLLYDATYPASSGEVLAFNGVLELT